MTERLNGFKFLNPAGAHETPYSLSEGAMIEGVEEVYRLACLELRGGNAFASYSAELPGLLGWISCNPLHPAIRGGDLHYLSACSHGSIARVVLADVAGHGEIVSAAALRLHDALREHVDHWDQSALIRELNESFLKTTLRAQYATAFLASFYSDSGELLFTNAGHLPPLWYRAAAREWTFLNESTPFSKEILDLPLGMIAGTGYSQTAVQIEPGDLLLLYTDGVSESFDESGEQLGLERLLAVANTLPTDSAASAGQALLAAVAEFRGSVLSADDETLIALERRALTV
jgi:sigma-B regulation protein RsbU (phosphoserine phosphatase)